MSNQQCCSPLDSQLLIKAIHNRPALWNKTHASHKDTDIIEKLWNEVSVEVNSPNELLKSRWKGLRDTFRKEFKKPGRSKWIHYKNLLFLEDMMIIERNLAKNSSSNSSCDCRNDAKAFDKCDDGETVPSNEEISSNCENEGDSHSNDEEGNDASVNDFAATEMLKTEIDESDSGPEQNTNNAKIKGRIASEGSDSEGGDKNPRTYLWTNDARYFNQGIDDDYHFFMSLIPHVKLLPLDQKLLLRMKMQEIIHNEIFSTTDHSNCSN